MNAQHAPPAGWKARLGHELRALAEAFLYFACWLGLLVGLKSLILAEYRVEFHGLSAALIGALVLSKVVLILESVPLGSWTRRTAAWIEVLVRTGLYSAGVVVVLLLEKGFEGRHEYGGFIPSLLSVFQHADIDHVWANTICVTAALLGFNLLSVVRATLGQGGLARMLRNPVPRGS